MQRQGEQIWNIAVNFYTSLIVEFYTSITGQLHGCFCTIYGLKSPRRVVTHLSPNLLVTIVFRVCWQHRRSKRHTRRVVLKHVTSTMQLVPWKV